MFEVDGVERRYTTFSGECPDLRRLRLSCESNCDHCEHRKVCTYRKQDLCMNFSLGSSAISCEGCEIHFSRFDSVGKINIPCFACRFEKEQDANFSLPDHAERLGILNEKREYKEPKEVNSDIRKV